MFLGLHSTLQYWDDLSSCSVRLSLYILSKQLCRQKDRFMLLNSGWALSWKVFKLSRHLKPPMRQVLLLVQDDSAVARLHRAKSIKQQLVIVCGAAFKAKPCWQKVPDTTLRAEFARVGVAVA